MALTITKVDEDVWGKKYVGWYNITLDSSYPSGGYTTTQGFTPIAFRVKNILEFEVVGMNAGGSGIVLVRFDYTNVKLMAFRTGTVTPTGTVAAPVFTGESYTPAGTVAQGVIPVTAGTAGDAVTNNAGTLESTGGQDLTVNSQAFTGTPHTLAGTNSAPAFTGTATGQGSLAEVTASANLSAVTVRVRVLGPQA